MAQAGRLLRFHIALSDVDRGVYDTLELRVSEHPSEKLEAAVLRTLAYGLHLAEGIGFSKGLCVPDEPAIYVRDPTGLVKTWIEIGLPSAERLHSATKKADEVWIYPTRDPQMAIAQWKKAGVHRPEAIRLCTFNPNEIAAICSGDGRKFQWELTRSEGIIYLNADGTSHTLNPQLGILSKMG